MTTELPDRLDQDPAEVQEWLQALADVVDVAGFDQAQFLLSQLNQEAAERYGLSAGAYGVHTPYCNTISVNEQPVYPGNTQLEHRIRAFIRWNAVAMVLRAGKKDATLGGHIASYASAAVLYEVGFNHFFRAATVEFGGDLIYIQGHSAPGIYARAFLEGRLTEAQLDHFRQEVGGKGLSSYPHPWLMSDFWQFATVSMGLGPLQAIYQARLLKYLHNRGLIDATGRQVWAFLGDGEMDEPESLGAIGIAAKEGLDNLNFVINCNLQRLDGPVRGNSKIIQELEGIFRGAGWHVIKVLWGSGWDELFAKDPQGLLLKRMNECVDGDYQAYRANDGAFIREHFFGKYPELKQLVADMSDDEIWHLKRGGHDELKVFAAYQSAVNHTGQPTVILAKTVKGFGMGAAGEGKNITHQQKKMNIEELKLFRDRFDIPLTDEQVAKLPFFRPEKDSEEMRYLLEHRANKGGFLPARQVSQETLPIPPLSAFSQITKDSGEHQYSTTMAFVRLLSVLLRDKTLSKRIVPIVPDECRTFGMEGMFRQYGIYSPLGQLYTPEDADQLMYYKEAKDGQILEEGITEAGAFCSWLAAATSYSTHQLPLMPFFIYYSMFGFQRIGDLAWAAGDMMARGFLLGATAGRTTLAGEGLQHQDGQSHILCHAIPNCVAYDPAFGYEVAVIMQHGMQRMFVELDNVFYYLTLTNENYHHPALPEDAIEGIIRGMYLFQSSEKNQSLHVQLLGSGTIFREVLTAAQWLEQDFQISSDVWSVTSFNELYKQAVDVQRTNLMQPGKKPQKSYVTQCLTDRQGPVIAATDYVKLYADQIHPFVPQRYVTLGTDGFGRSDTRQALRHHFEVDAKYIVLAALKALADEEKIPVSKVAAAMKKYQIDPNKPNPLTS
ncbi:MAG: pyruvate dehydrogenase (acetyl-transferring), homodimeric type [Legionellales bacterium]|nr:pyruvate dehydrogenase (acetyl-transferring), homodimeric type [Legionellales bacterium]